MIYKIVTVSKEKWSEFFESCDRVSWIVTKGNVKSLSGRFRKWKRYDWEGKKINIFLEK